MLTMIFFWVLCMVVRLDRSFGGTTIRAPSPGACTWGQESEPHDL